MALKEFRFKVPAEIYLSVRADNEEDARKKLGEIINLADLSEELPVNFESLIGNPIVEDTDLELCDGCAYFAESVFTENIVLELIEERELENEDSL